MKNPEPGSLFNFGSSTSLCGNFWSKNVWIDDCSRSLNRSRILIFEKLPDPDPDPESKILEQERSRSLKKWLRPPLVGAQVQVTSAIKSRRHATIITSPTENPNSKRKKMVSKETRRLAESVEGLNTSLSQSADELWSCNSCKFGSKKWPKRDLKDCLSQLITSIVEIRYSQTFFLIFVKASPISHKSSLRLAQ